MRHRRPPGAADDRGTTMVEITIALMLFGVVLLSMYNSITTALTSVAASRSHMNAEQSVRRGAERMVEELRWGDAIVSASATSLRVHVPAGQPFSAGAYEVVFARDTSTNQLTRTEHPAAGTPITTVLSNNITALAFRFYDQCNTEVSTAAAIRRVVIDAEGSSTEGGGASTRAMRSGATLRNYELAHPSPSPAPTPCP